eukprot:GEMP01024028.1.p1 GENE.GEMP01024028.1~~GEMP01024028.1.p1  ORF type:complete len:468 (-),score=102.98 GEMP01024028.1:876-2279(-)
MLTADGAMESVLAQLKEVDINFDVKSDFANTPHPICNGILTHSQINKLSFTVERWFARWNQEKDVDMCDDSEFRAREIEFSNNAWRSELALPPEQRSDKGVQQLATYLKEFPNLSFTEEVPDSLFRYVRLAEDGDRILGHGRGIKLGLPPEKIIYVMTLRNEADLAKKEKLLKELIPLLQTDRENLNCWEWVEYRRRETVQHPDKRPKLTVIVDGLVRLEQNDRVSTVGRSYIFGVVGLSKKTGVPLSFSSCSTATCESDYAVCLKLSHHDFHALYAGKSQQRLQNFLRTSERFVESVGYLDLSPVPATGRIAKDRDLSVYIDKSEALEKTLKRVLRMPVPKRIAPSACVSTKVEKAKEKHAAVQLKMQTTLADRITAFTTNPTSEYNLSPRDLQQIRSLTQLQRSSSDLEEIHKLHARGRFLEHNGSAVDSPREDSPLVCIHRLPLLPRTSRPDLRVTSKETPNRD